MVQNHFKSSLLEKKCRFFVSTQLKRKIFFKSRVKLTLVNINEGYSVFFRFLDPNSNRFFFRLTEPISEAESAFFSSNSKFRQFGANGFPAIFELNNIKMVF